MDERPEAGQEGAKSPVEVHLLWLTLLCAVVFLWGLAAHGLTNWQEAQRALVAREMYQAGEWIVPTVGGEPYIAKPPLIYWVQMIFAQARDALGLAPFSDETEIRLTVALGGWLGVLATCVFGRRILRGASGAGAREAELGALIGALGLASGVLYVRSSRIGELDVLLVPFVVSAVGAIDAARRRHEEQRRTAFGWVLVAAVAALGAALTKGPPALLVIALAGYAPILVRAAMRPSIASADGETPPIGDRLAWPAALAGGLVLGGWSARAFGAAADAFGVVFYGAVGVAIGWGLARLARPSAVREWFGALARTHPVGVLGAAGAALWGWGRLVAARVGGERVAALANEEVQDNLRVLVLDSPARNIGFMLYGLLPIGLAAVAGFVWIVLRRPRLESGRLIPPVWCALGLASFSALGKGVARYLTPVWPGVALLGGMWLARGLCDEEKPHAARARALAAIITVLVACAIGQGWWYAHGRQVFFADRSPREKVAELLARYPGASIGTYEIDEPAIAFYARAPVRRFGRKEVDEVAAWVERTRSGVLLLSRRETSEARSRFGSVVEALRERGIRATEVSTVCPFTWRGDGAEVVAYRLEAGGLP